MDSLQARRSTCSWLQGSVEHQPSRRECAGRQGGAPTAFSINPPPFSRPPPSVSYGRLGGPESAFPEDARPVLHVLIGTYTALDAQVKHLDAEVNRRAKADPAAPRLTMIPGVSPISARRLRPLRQQRKGSQLGVTLPPGSG
jgi:transposase